MLKPRTVAAALLMGAALAGPASAQGAGDPVAGKAVFKKCQACHAVGPGATNKIGPELNGIVGEAIASVEGYSFSPGLVEYAKAHPAWDESALTAWLTNPKAEVPKTKMAFPGLKKPEEIANVIAYLKTFSETGDPAP